MYEGIRNQNEPWVSRVKLVLIGFSIIAGFFLIAEHRAHVFPFLPYLLLATCPILHFFMHGGHDHGGHRHGQVPDDESASDGSAPRSPATKRQHSDSDAPVEDATGAPQHGADATREPRPPTHAGPHGGGGQ